MIRRVEVAFVLALVCASSAAAAQQVPIRYHRHPNPAHHYSRAAKPIAVPQQFAPPQEAFASAPEKETTPPPPPSACQTELAKVAVFKPLGKLVGAGECGAPDAVLLDAVILPDQTKVAVSPPATLRCTMAVAVAGWVRDDVAPASMQLGSPPRSLIEIGSYGCRGRDNVRGATLSEHGLANALDVRAFKLANGKTLVLVDPNAPKDWREAVRAGACARFATVLGPGSDAEHGEHVHIDLEERRNNYKICEWDVRVPLVVQAKGETPAAIPIDEVPLPRPRPVAASSVDDEKRPATRRLRHM